MRIRARSGVEIDVDESLILAAAGAIYASRRKTFGGPPLKAFACRWCGAACHGHAALSEHERACAVSQPDLVPGVGRLSDLL